MKYIPHLTFTFAFENINTKKESGEALKKFLSDNEWITGRYANDRLINFHSENNGVCEVILFEREDSSLEELSEIFFDDLFNEKSVKWVKTIYDDNTEKIVLKYVDYYPNHQNKSIGEMVKGDSACILWRQ